VSNVRAQKHLDAERAAFNDEEVVVVGAVHVAVWRAVGVLGHGDEGLLAQDLAVRVTAEADGVRRDGDPVECVRESPASQDARGIGRDLDSCSDLSSSGSVWAGRTGQRVGVPLRGDGPARQA